MIDAVIGSTDEPDILKSFAVNCIMAPAPDSLCTVAKPNDRPMAFANIRL